ncbi:MAG: phosphoribosyltransferase family protein [Gammaproteobacteria bacterium]|nr:phosphoribosyltransferase family protein [Gammaproteobacteria bacterium]MDH3466846.1 phosphoribosyltransferase family protein [Gammaproteobacteria bacterium]
MEKQYVEEQALLNDSYRLALKVYDSGFRPDFIVGVWRGGSTVGIYVQECLQYLGVETDHIAIRTSYRGMDDYLQRYDSPQKIRVHGLQYLLENINHDDSLLIVDDVFGTGRNVEAVINRLQTKAKRNVPHDIRIATPFYKPTQNQTGRTPDYYLHETNRWLVLPYELTGLSMEEIRENKSWILPILNECGTDDTQQNGGKQ